MLKRSQIGKGSLIVAENESEHALFNSFMIAGHEPIPQGTKWKIAAKGQMAFINANMDTTTTYPLENVETKDIIHVEIKKILSDFKLADDTPVAKITVIKDKTTGLFFKPPGFANTEVTWHKTRGSAKTFNDIGKAKNYLLMVTGYFNSPEFPESMQYHGQILDWYKTPNTWEIQELNKDTLEVLKSVNVLEYLNDAYSLRELSKKFGPSVRDLYQKLEKDNKLDDFYGVVLWKNPNVEIDSSWKQTPFTNYKWGDEENCIKSAKLKKGEFYKSKNVYNLAIAVKDVNRAIQLRLMYHGNLEVAILDFKHIQEIV